MDSITAMAASGLRSRMETLDLAANNLANAATGGYKADRAFYSLYLAPEAQDSGDVSTMPVIEKPWVDLSQGVVHTTGNPLDLALSGKGFFAVQGPGGPLYTRNGNFHMAPDGSLVTADGYAVRGAAGGAALMLQPGRSIDIGADGTIRQNGAVVGKLEIADFTSTAGLAKQGGNYFRSSGAPAALPPDTSVQQGKLEDSNTSSPAEAVRLINLMRQFEMLQKAATLGEQMSQQAIEQVAKVGS
jgi:flagellar basal-body rod protein FlgF